MRRGIAAIAVALLLSGCSLLAPNSSSGKANSQTLEQLKAAAHIADCPQTSAPPTGGLPTATLPCLGGGRSVVPASLRGPMLINLWATYCFACRDEMPLLQAFSKKYAGRVAVLGVDYQDTQLKLALEFAKSVGATYPQAADPVVGMNPPVFRAPFLPHTILIDAHGKIVFEQAVAFASVAQIEQTVQKYLGVRP